MTATRTRIPAPRRSAGRLAALLVCLAVLAGCSTGDDAAVYGGSFTFVSPGGKTDISYPVADRGTVGNLSGPDLTGDGTLSLADYAGKVVVINFWGSWCPPCRAEQPGLNLASEKLADQGVQFLGIDLEKGLPRSSGQDYHRSFQVPYPSIYDPTMRTILSLRGYPAASIPSTIVLDRQHRVAQIWLTSVSMDELQSVVSDIAAEKEQS
jgi:thiol-disulfide isomerase/thioredoxin